MTSDQNEPKSATDLPKAEIVERNGFSIIWVVPVVAAAIAGWLVYKKVTQAGPMITILFTDGKGLQTDQTVVKYRGVRVGDVRQIGLTEDQHNVEVKARLDKSAASLARDGSLFWIVRPEISAGMVRGLETLVPGPHIEVQPGSGKEKHKFIGLNKSPVAKVEDGGIDIVLMSPQLGSLMIGSPVYYRGVEVGAVQEYVLSDDALTVNLQVHIGPRYVPLVRQTSKFWNAGGMHVDLSLFGLEVRALSLKSLMVGGVAFATPDPPGQPASRGLEFRLYDKPKDEWLAWLPKISLRAQEK